MLRFSIQFPLGWVELNEPKPFAFDTSTDTGISNWIWIIIWTNSDKYCTNTGYEYNIFELSAKGKKLFCSY